MFVCAESDVSPAIGIRFPCLPACVCFDISASVRVFCFGVREPNYGSSDSHSR